MKTATSALSQRLADSAEFVNQEKGRTYGSSARGPAEASKVWMVLDGFTVLAAATIVITFQAHRHALPIASVVWHGSLAQGRPVNTMFALLLGFTIPLVIISRQLHLYTPTRLGSFLHEQRLSMQACLTAGLLLTGVLYLFHAEGVPRGIVVLTVILVSVGLGLRRFVYRMLLYRSFERGMGTRNVLILGTGPEAHALRHHMDHVGRLGYRFKGFIDLPESCKSGQESSADVIGTLDSLFQHTRRYFVDEIVFPCPREPKTVQDVLSQARIHGVDLRIVPDLYGGLAWGKPIEFVGQFPTVLLHYGRSTESGRLFKRVLDIVLSGCALCALSPLILVIAIAVKIGSQGQVFYQSERIGLRGRTFKCIKFRTMVRDAEKMRDDVMHLNERDGVLFKITDDPRVTPIGRLLRKYSLDELPQFFNVMRGEMSIVGPRPPLASEVRQYDLSHLRRLDVKPGITGLWQVQARQDPSFDSYISLDVAYIDNWSIWLDLKIIARTVGVVLAGTGS